MDPQDPTPAKARLALRALTAAERLTLLLCGLIAAYITVDSLYCLFRYYTAIPYQDQWETVFEYTALSDKHFAFSPLLSQLLAQHNEHRLVFPRLSFYADYRLAGGENWLALAFVWLIQLAHVAILIALLPWRRRDGHTAMEPAAAAAAIVCLMVGIGQWQNLTWGFQTQFVGVYMLASAAFCALGVACRRDLAPSTTAIALAAAMGLLFCATFSMANGLIATGIAVLLCLALRARIWIAAALGLFLLLTGLAYFHGYHAVASNSPMSLALTHPVDFVRYVLSFLGNPIGDWRLRGPATPLAPLLQAAPMIAGAIAAAAGAGALLLTAAGRADRRQAIAAAIVLFVLVSAGLTALGRMSFGVDMAFSSRYRTPVGVLWSALIVFWLPYVKAPRRRWVAPAFLAACAVVALSLSWEQAYSHLGLKAYRQSVRLAEDAMLSGADDLTAFSTVYPRPRIAVQRIPFLRRLHKSVFDEPRAAWLGQPIGAVKTIKAGICTGAVDAIEWAPFGASNSIRVTGWAWGRGRGRPAERLLLTNDRMQIVGYASAGIDRPDVATALHEPKAVRAGFVGEARSAGGVVHAFADLPGGLACEVGSRSAASLAPTMTVVTNLPPRMVGGDLAEVRTRDAAWLENGAPGSVTATPARVHAYASWTGADAHKGAIAFGSFVTDASKLSVGVVTGPDPTGQGLRLKDAATGEVLAELKLTQMPNWNWVSLEIPERARGRALVLEGVDAGSGWGQWMGMTAPRGFAPSGGGGAPTPALEDAMPEA